MVYLGNPKSPNLCPAPPKKLAIRYSTNNGNPKIWKGQNYQFLRVDRADIDAYRTQSFV
jgi:hypothetical protein